MRKANMFAWLIVFLAIAGLSGCVNVDSDSDFNSGGRFTSTDVFGSGVVAEENRTVIGITGVVLAGEGNLYIEEGAAEELIVTAEDNLLPYILTEVQGGILEIRTRSNINLEPTLPIEYYLTVVSLESVLLSGVGDITVSDLMIPRISGTVDAQRLNVTGLGEYDARDLSSLDGVISIVGNANQTATVRVSDMLTVTINGNGTVFYIGDPFVDANIIGSGSVQQILG
jgi:hypothetical protein